jgi:hypothetical protein
MIRITLILVVFLVGLKNLAKSATILTVSGSGSGNVGYPTYSGSYVNVAVQFNLPSLSQGEYYESGNLQINYSFSAGQERSTGRTLSANINSQQLESWSISPGSNQSKIISLASGALLNFTSLSGQNINTVINLTMPAGFDRFTQRGWVTVDSSQLTLNSVPELSSLSLLFAGGAVLMAWRRRG